ncbi:hypothetical protein EU244_030235 [Rhodococcus qingshengii]|uniref:hypothetical protein n=1 Tax=Rhodococcus qingshengii TaxID=334542 RepID=UPI0010A63949|nr:hypothetical protein [Rhodococcus qingshengii]THJ67700.1 hypothetical protein EU244_26270 [Rhodococcus qingshengii]
MTSSLAAPIDQKYYDLDPVWGPNSYPAKASIEEGSAPWKDHIYLAFWDPASEAYGFFHWNSSPNHPTTKAQLNFSLGGTNFDLREVLPAREDRFDSESIKFDMKSNIVIDHPRMQGQLTLTPRRGPIDFTTGGSIPRFKEQEPLQHYQHPLSMKGVLTLDGVDFPIDALGYRTRTWGFRDDSVQFPEYYYLYATFDDFDIAVIKHLHPDGVQRTGGALVNDSGTIPILDVHIPKDIAGFAIETRYDLADGSEVVIVDQKRLWGGWCPIGLPRREGPTFAAFDEILEVRTPDGKVGYGQSEYGMIRQIH